MEGGKLEGKEDRFSWRERLARLGGKREELVGREGHDTASSFKVAGEKASNRINVGFGGGSGVGPRGDTKGRWETRRCHGWGSGMQSLSEGKRKLWEGILHLVAWCCGM